ncbi:MAG: 50S ribosomal protein L35 [Candidatus Nealsonbacteria bacterium]|nr:50S ribosomal protein L35 [Candidatus Nealsonbacteria bacterium]
MKTRKSLTKRFRITKNGKVLRRLTGQNHFRMKKSSKERSRKRKWVLMSKPEAKVIKRLMSF